jgi:hypothetical protein
VSITTWNRLECDTVFDDPARGVGLGLAAGVFDPLWLLARQIQMGELVGEDGGSLIHAGVTSAANPLAGVTVASHTAPFDPAAPLESVVEREPSSVDLRLRIRAGLVLVELFAEQNLTRLIPLSIEHFGLTPVPGGDAEAGSLVALAHQQGPDGEQVRAAFDGGQLATALGVTQEESQGFDAAMVSWLAWYRPRAGLDDAGSPAPDAWVSDRLEHTFSMTAATSAGVMQLVAPEYPGGRLDWDAFTLHDVSGDPATPQIRTLDALPLPVDIPGMPVVRFWELEDPRFDVARVSVGPGDTTRLLLVEFALTFASDWFLVPVPVPVGALIGIDDLTVTDTFGVVTRIPAAEQVRSDPSWALWRLTDAGGLDRAGNLLLVPPPPAGGLESDSIEEVAFVRDEQANLVWAIEVTVPASIGGGRPVDRRLPPPEPLPPLAAADGLVPERIYVPLVSLPPDRVPLARVDRADGSWLARAEVVDELTSVTPTEGRLLTPAFAVRDDEVGVDGVVVTRRFQLARGQDGRRYVWTSRAKRPGATRAGEPVGYDVLAEPPVTAS